MQTWRVSIATLSGKTYEGSISEKVVTWELVQLSPSCKNIYISFKLQRTHIWITQHYQKKHINVIVGSFTCSVKANRNGEYISWPNDRRHLAPSPKGSILRWYFPMICQRIKSSNSIRCEGKLCMLYVLTLVKTKNHICLTVSPLQSSSIHTSSSSASVIPLSSSASNLLMKGESSY